MSETPIRSEPVFSYIYGDRSRISPRDQQAPEQSHICERCLNPFVARPRLSGKLRDSIEYEPLRKKLMLGPDAEPVLCDGCFIDIMSWQTPDPMTDAMPASRMPTVMRG